MLLFHSRKSKGNFAGARRAEEPLGFNVIAPGEENGTIDAVEASSCELPASAGQITGPDGSVV